jgi:hypothetical protein
MRSGGAASWFVQLRARRHLAGSPSKQRQPLPHSPPDPPTHVLTNPAVCPLRKLNRRCAVRRRSVVESRDQPSNSSHTGDLARDLTTRVVAGTDNSRQGTARRRDVVRTVLRLRVQHGPYEPVRRASEPSLMSRHGSASVVRSLSNRVVSACAGAVAGNFSGGVDNLALLTIAVFAIGDGAPGYPSADLRFGFIVLSRYVRRWRIGATRVPRARAIRDAASTTLCEPGRVRGLGG